MLSNGNTTNLRQIYVAYALIKLNPGTVSNELLGCFQVLLVLRTQPHPQFLKWYKTFSWLLGSHNNRLTRQ